MRLINLMTFVFVLLVLAMIPAFVHFAQATGTPRAASLAVFAGIIAVMAARREHD
jgi:uncharacterized membrane protein